MDNFSDLCNQCEENKLILPSLEAFELGIEAPTVHMVFYEFFLKSCVGDAHWKSLCLEPPEGLTMKMVEIPLEAFAMILLKNNYFAWLLAAKKKMGDTLITDYDEETVRFGKKYFPDVLLQDMEVNFVDMPEGATFTASPEIVEKLLVSQSEPRFAALKQATQRKLDAMRTEASFNETYHQVMDAVTTMTGSDDEQELGDSETAEKARKERRSLLKKFRFYTTNETDAKNCFKGWSKQTAFDHCKLTKHLRQKETQDQYDQFRAAYRHLCQQKQKTRKRKAPLQEAPKIDFVKDVWGDIQARRRVEI